MVVADLFRRSLRAHCDKETCTRARGLRRRQHIHHVYIHTYRHWPNMLIVSDALHNSA